MDKLAIFVLISVVVTAWITAMNDDFEHEKMQAENYKKMVCAGFWPDYNSVNPDCSDVK